MQVESISTFVKNQLIVFYEQRNLILLIMETPILTIGITQEYKMDRVIINISNFKHPRIKMEQFSFTKEEEASLNKELNKLVSIFSEKVKTVFSVSKQDGLFSGSLKINSSDLYSYGKASTAISLFYKLRERIKKRVLEQSTLIN